jgi:hypothetical protein
MELRRRRRQPRQGDRDVVRRHSDPLPTPCSPRPPFRSSRRDRLDRAARLVISRVKT